MVSVLPITLKIVACFISATSLLNRYADLVNNNIITIVGVFISWFFSFMVIFLLPADLTSTAYRQCLLDFQESINSSTPLPQPSMSNVTSLPLNLSQPVSPLVNIIPQHSAFSNDIIAPLPSPILLFVPPNSTNVTNPCVLPWSYVSDDALTKLWRFIYWTSQFLTWLVLPIMQSYSMAGDFTRLDKLRSAIRANLIYYSTFGAIFLLLLLYILFNYGLHNFTTSVKVILITSSNTWGLFLLVILLGYGLVELPRYMISRSGYSHSLSQLYFKVAQVNAEKCEAEEKLDDVLEEIHQVFSNTETIENSPLKKYLNKIVDRCPADWKNRSNAFRRQANASTTNYDLERPKAQIHDIESLVRLHRKVISVVHRHRQINCRWNHLIKEVVEWEDVAKNQTESQGTFSNRAFSSSLPRERTLLHSIYTPKVEWYWKCLIRVWVFKLIGIILAIFSLAVVWSEIAFPISFFSPKLSIFAFFIDWFQSAQQYFYLEVSTMTYLIYSYYISTYLINSSSQNQLFSTITMGYLAICAFYTVFHMKIYNIYYLAPNSQTDEYSLLFSGMLLCRLTAALCLNYLALVHKDSHIVKRESTIETSFTTIMGHLDLIPLVNDGLNIFLPLCISAICSAIYFNFGTHVLHSLGFEQFIEDDEMTIDWVQTGRDLVKREKTKLLRNLESSSSSYHGLV